MTEKRIRRFARLYALTTGTWFAGLMILRIADERLFGGEMMYPQGEPNAWTWALWGSIVLVAAPFVMIGVIDFLRLAIGPTELAPEHRKKPPS